MNIKSLISKIKREVFKYRWLVLAVLVIAGSFYWFEWRPVEIRKECSYVERHTAAVPEVTQAQVDQQKQAFESCQKEYPPTHELEGLFGGAGMEVNSSQCAPLASGYNDTPHSAEPSTIYYTNASNAQYDFCLHSRGI